MKPAAEDDFSYAAYKNFMGYYGYINVIRKLHFNEFIHAKNAYFAYLTNMTFNARFPKPTFLDFVISEQLKRVLNNPKNQPSLK